MEIIMARSVRTVLPIILVILATCLVLVWVIIHVILGNPVTGDSTASVNTVIGGSTVVIVPNASVLILASQ